MVESLWLTLVCGVIVGAALGYTYSWRLARKLESHNVRLRDWDAFDYEAENIRAVQRLREYR
jgi:hypothetical protein